MTLERNAFLPNFELANFELANFEEINPEDFKDFDPEGSEHEKTEITVDVRVHDLLCTPEDLVYEDLLRVGKYEETSPKITNSLELKRSSIEKESAHRRVRRKQQPSDEESSNNPKKSGKGSRAHYNVHQVPEELQPVYEKLYGKTVTMKWQYAAHLIYRHPELLEEELITRLMLEYPDRIERGKESYANFGIKKPLHECKNQEGIKPSVPRLEQYEKEAGKEMFEQLSGAAREAFPRCNQLTIGCYGHLVYKHGDKLKPKGIAANELKAGHEDKYRQRDRDYRKMIKHNPETTLTCAWCEQSKQKEKGTLNALSPF